MRKEHGVIFGVIGIVIFFFCGGCGADWRLLNQYDYGDGWSVSQYYDAKNIVNTDAGNLRVWVRQNDEKVREDPLEDLPTFRRLVQINCISGEMRYLRVITQLKDGDYEEMDERLDYMVPDSSKDTLSKAICGGVAR